MRENDAFIDALETLSSRIAETRFYLDSQASNTRLAIAYLARLKAKKSHLLGQLRANKIELERVFEADSSDSLHS